MGINIYPLIIICCILLQNCKSKNPVDEIVRPSSLECKKIDVPLVSYVCTPPKPVNRSHYELHENDLTDDLQFLKIDMGFIYGYTWFMSEPDMFKRFSRLSTLHINTSYRWVFDDSFNISQFTSTLLTLSNLEILHLTFTNDFKRPASSFWTLTDNLKNFHLENAIMTYNLSTSNYLQSLSLINCSLKNIPENKGLYYLTNLNLRNNRLENMTVLDIASFCSLENLNIADAKMNHCECKKMNRLFLEIKNTPMTKLFTVKCNCNRSINIGNCPKFDWDEVRKKRIPCLKAITSTLLHTIGFIVFSVFVIISVVIGVAVFVLRYPYPEVQI